MTTMKRDEKSDWGWTHLNALLLVLGLALTGSPLALANHLDLPNGEPSLLIEPGQDAFATIQEVIRHLNDDPTTNWRQINLEALRLHLRDMNAIVMEVDVSDIQSVDFGLKVLVQPRTPLAAAALSRMLSAHPAVLYMETGWQLQVTREKSGYRLTTTGDDIMDTDKIRGLGYIGWMAMGDHHRLHHWGIATGSNPHEAHH